MKVAVVTDSTSDMLDLDAERLGVTVVPLYVHIRGATLKDRVEIQTSDIFRAVTDGAAIPSTSQPAPADFAVQYERLLATHDKVLAVCCSGSLSGTLTSANLAAQNFPGRVITFDSLSASGGLQMQAERAARLLKTGASVPDTLATLARIRGQAYIRFTVGTLEYLRRNGRIGGATAFLGTLLNVKPILSLSEGRIEAAGRSRGDHRAMQDQIDYLRAYKETHGAVRAFYLYTDEPDACSELREAGRAMGVQEFGGHQTGAVISCHVGPGTYGCCVEPLEA